MTKNILFRGFTPESNEVKIFLNDNNINFVEVFSERDNDPPTFMPSINNHEYRGYDKIVNFIQQRFLSRKKPSQNIVT